jgi:hypothetical protein
MNVIDSMFGAQRLTRKFRFAEARAYQAPQQDRRDAALETGMADGVAVGYDRLDEMLASAASVQGGIV